MELIKVLRLRATEVQIEERLGINVGTGGFKGGVTDVRLEVYVESVTSTVDGKVETWEDYQLKFIELFKPVAPNTAPTPDPEKKYSNYLIKHKGGTLFTM